MWHLNYRHNSSVLRADANYLINLSTIKCQQSLNDCFWSLIMVDKANCSNFIFRFTTDLISLTVNTMESFYWNFAIVNWHRRNLWYSNSESKELVSYLTYINSNWYITLSIKKRCLFHYSAAKLIKSEPLITF